MRVLWLCNIMLPVIAKQMGLPGSNKEGWLSGLAAKAAREKPTDMTLGVCFPVAGEPVQGETDGMVWYGFSEDTAHPERYDPELEGRLGRILSDFQPDVLHCFGTEYPHTLAMVRAFGRPRRTLIGIQGLCFVYADAYMADLPEKIQRRTLLRDFLKRDNLLCQQDKYRQRGVFEQEALRQTGHVTGRTGWDRKWTAHVNPDAVYHFMNETLRPSFYGPKWDIGSCMPWSIFVSQGNYPIKGLHYLLQAMPAVLKRYPSAHLYVAGDEITRISTWKEKLKLSNYGKYLRELIAVNHLEGAVTFLGRLDEDRMLQRFLRSHVFISPSSIENSPNSVGEAMLLGMPVISSDVGGGADMLRRDVEGYLYPPGDVAMLAERICTVFDPHNQEMIQDMGGAARKHALQTHDPETNYRRLLEIYHEIYLCIELYQPSSDTRVVRPL